MRRVVLAAWVVSVVVACSQSDLHPPPLPDCPTCIANPIIYLRFADASADGAADASVDAPSMDGPMMDAPAADAPSGNDAGGDVALDSADGD